MIFKLNESQQQVVNHLDGPLSVCALAGSGKTSAIVHRCVALVDVGVPQNRILAVTFSKAGADVMNTRLQSLLGGRATLRIGTFHSVGLQILTKELFKGAHPPVKNAYYEIEVKKLLAKYRKNRGEAPPHELVVKFISFCKSHALEAGSPQAHEEAKNFARKGMQRVPADILAAIYTDVEYQRKQEKYVTFDDMLFDTVLHLESDEAARVRWANKFDYVIQDEAQDQNVVQHKLGDLLARDHKNYCIVGDKSQCIFGWRGASHGSIETFTQAYGARVIRLEENYRSGPKILALGEKILHNYDLDKQAKLTCTRVNVEDNVRAFAFTNEQREAKFIVDEIDSLLVDGYKHHDIAILIRNGLQSLPFEATLAERKIPFHLAIGTPFYKRRDVATLISYLRIATFTEKTEDWEVALKRPTKYLTLGHIERIIGAAKRAVQNTTTLQIIKQAQGTDYGYAWRYAQEWATVIDEFLGGCAEKNAGVVLSRIVEQTKYEEFLTKEGEVDLNDDSLESSHLLLIHELLKRASKFTVKAFLKDVDNTLKFAVSQPKVKNKVSLTTVHRAKGLEWPIVYVVGVTTGLFPHKGNKFDEEARIFYVAVTRAMNDLTVTGSGVDDSVFLSTVTPLERVTNAVENVEATIDGVKYFVEESL